MIWSYLCPTKDRAALKRFYGCPVDVLIDGKRRQVVYQFGGGGQDYAVIHWQSGWKIADVFEEMRVGAPQEQAQRAVDYRLQGVPPGLYDGIIAQTTVINTVPQVEGPFGPKVTYELQG